MRTVSPMSAPPMLPKMILSESLTIRSSEDTTGSCHPGIVETGVDDVFSATFNQKNQLVGWGHNQTAGCFIAVANHWYVSQPVSQPEFIK